MDGLDRDQHPLSLCIQGKLSPADRGAVFYLDDQITQLTRFKASSLAIDSGVRTMLLVQPHDSLRHSVDFQLPLLL